MSKIAFRRKDKLKFAMCNKLISRGYPGTSSYKYCHEGIGNIDPSQVNTMKYEESDVVGISSNGKHPQRQPASKTELDCAIEAGVTFVTDNPYHRNRPYNIGEREVCQYLNDAGYVEEVLRYCSQWKLNTLKT